MPSWLRIGGSVIFFLIMIDDTLFYFGLMAIVYWSAKQVNKRKEIDLLNSNDQHSLTEGD
jgi:hypothetical protein